MIISLILTMYFVFTHSVIFAVFFRQITFPRTLLCNNRNNNITNRETFLIIIVENKVLFEFLTKEMQIVICQNTTPTLSNTEKHTQTRTHMRIFMILLEYTICKATSHYNDCCYKFNKETGNVASPFVNNISHNTQEKLDV